MDLKTVFSSVSAKFGHKEEANEEFLAIKISATEVAAAVWKIATDKVQLGELTSAEVTGKEFADLLQATDKAVSAVPETVNKVIFGLPFHWVSDGKIDPERLSLLRRLCKELDLAPMGYVLLSEALENYYKEVDGAPLTAILLEFDGDDGLVTMYRAGKNLGTATFSAANEDLNSELEKALKNFTQAEILPSRIILYDGKSHLEQIAEKIMAFPWTKTLPFLHFPKVEVFDSAHVVQAIAVAGGMQMGGHFDLEDNPEIVAPPVLPENPPEEIPPEEALGEKEAELELEEVSAEEAGFLPDMPTPGPVGQFKEMEIVSKPETVPQAKQFNFSATIAPLLAKFKTLSLPKLPKLPTLSFKTPAVAPLVVAVIGAVVLLFGLAVYQIPQVTVLLRVSSPPFDKELAVTVVTEKSTKPASDSAKAITGTFLDVTELGTKKSVTTGRKLVGDKAKGTVTLYSAASSHTFPAGTVLSSPAGLKFTLDQGVEIASGDAITRATVTSPITAADIGDTYNLAAGTKFTVAGLSSSDYAAQTDQALAGGTSHQANVVTKDDQTRLLATLSAELTDKAKADLAAKLTDGQTLLPNAITSTISKKKFSKDVDAEADTVSLDLTTDFEGVIFSQSDLVGVFAHNFGSDIPTGFDLSSDRATINIKDIKTDKSGNAIMQVHLSGGLLPKIDTPDVLSHLSGKSLSAATAYLSQIPGAGEVTIDTSPKIFAGIVKLALPWKKDHLKLEVVSN